MPAGDPDDTGRVEPGSDAELDLLQHRLPRQTWETALKEAHELREREQRALAADELERLRRYYPPGPGISQVELMLTYAYTGRLLTPGRLMPWEHVEAELSEEPESAREARLLELQLAEAEQRLRAQRQQLRVEKQRQPAATEEGVLLPTALVEEAMRLHAHEGLGRPKLQVELPGLGEWGARAVLYSAKVGHPFGLWLENDRLQWGPAITPEWPPGVAPGAEAPPKLRLPRP